MLTKKEILNIADKHFSVNIQSITDEQIIEFAKDILDADTFYKRRIEELQKIQSQMRDPERKMVCDILSNGHPSPLGYKIYPEKNIPNGCCWSDQSDR